MEKDTGEHVFLKVGGASIEIQPITNIRAEPNRRTVMIGLSDGGEISSRVEDIPPGALENPGDYRFIKIAGTDPKTGQQGTSVTLAHRLFGDILAGTAQKSGSK